MFGSKSMFSLVLMTETLENIAKGSARPRIVFDDDSDSIQFVLAPMMINFSLVFP